MVLTALTQKLFPSSGQFPEKSEPERFGEHGGCKTATNRNWKKGTTQSRGERLLGQRGVALGIPGEDLFQLWKAMQSPANSSVSGDGSQSALVAERFV